MLLEEFVNKIYDREFLLTIIDKYTGEYRCRLTVNQYEGISRKLLEDLYECAIEVNSIAIVNGKFSVEVICDWAGDL